MLDSAPISNVHLSADSALTAVIRSSPTSVLILSELSSGALVITSGPDMTVERASWILDRAKFALLSAANQTTLVPVVVGKDQ